MCELRSVTVFHAMSVMVCDGSMSITVYDGSISVMVCDGSMSVTVCDNFLCYVGHGLWGE